MISLSPCDIDVLLHHHTSPSPHDSAEFPAIKESVEWFVANGVLKRDGEGILRTTPMGCAFVKSICSTQLPVHAWKNPTTGELIE